MAVDENRRVRHGQRLILDGESRGVGGGVITRVAGTGALGNTGDDGPATDAELNQPDGVAVTAGGGFLIADTLNSVVRAVSAAGVITRITGTCTAGNSGDDGPATDACPFRSAGSSLEARRQQG